MKKCETCRYGNEYELDKPCIVYREDCPLYEKEGDGMNREEAIKILENERDNHINRCKGVFYETRTEAIDMAIKALEQEPSGDLISRQAVQDYIAKYLSQYLYNDVREAVEVIDEYIGELPSVTQKSETVTEFADRCRECGAKYGKLLKQEPKTIQEKQAESEKYQKAFDDGYENGYAQARFDYEQEPKTGHWIEKDGFDGDVYYDCSECGESWTTIEGTPWQNGMAYCPNCGAKMIGSQESDHKCHNCKHYTSGEYDGSCDSYICNGYSDWESEG